MSDEESIVFDALTMDIIAGQGFCPLNFTPFVEVQKVVAVKKVKWLEPSMEFTTPNVKGQLLFREMIEMNPSPGERYGLASLIWNEAEGKKYFIPWPVADLLINGVQASMAFFIAIGQGITMGDNWWFTPKGGGMSKRLNVEYVDSRGGRKPQRFSHIVILKLGNTRSVENVTQHLKSTMKSLWFTKVSESSQDADIDIFEEPKTLDPVTFTPISIPIRPLSCKHPQAMDLNGAVGYLNQKLPVGGANGLACPSCNEFFYIRDLIIDKTFMNFLKDKSRSEKMTSFEDYCRRYNDSEERIPGKDPLVFIAGNCYVSHEADDPPLIGRVLSPCCSLPQHYQETGVTMQFSESFPCPGSWKTYPGVPLRYFVRGN